MCIYWPIKSNRMWHKINFFKQRLTGLNLEFFFSYTCFLTKAKGPNLSFYLPLTGGRIIRLVPFPRALVLCEMQPASSKNWTHLAVFIFRDGNRYSTSASLSSDLILKVTNICVCRWFFCLMAYQSSCVI